MSTEPAAADLAGKVALITGGTAGVGLETGWRLARRGVSLAVVLTGMGTDGTHGATDVVASGGSVIAQDEETSVVWGMPRSVAQAGLCSAVLPLKDIAPKILRLFSGVRA